MTNSPIRIAIFSALSTLLLSTVVHAQQSAPLTLDAPLVPQVLEPISGAGDDIEKSVKQAGEKIVIPVPKNGAVDSIEVNVLSTVTSDTAGLLREQDGGYPFQMWRGSNRATVDALFDQLPVLTRSPTMRDMIRRLLISQSEPPENGPNLNNTEGSFVARRLELLANMGDSKAVSNLLSVTPGRTSSERLLRIESEASLLQNDYAKACVITNEFMKGSIDAYWQKLFIFCQILSSQTVEAELGMSLMREIGVSDEFLFLMFDAMIRSETPVIDTLPDPSPLHVAVLRASQARLSGEILSDPVPSVLPAIATNADTHMETRLLAAEQAVAANVLDVSVLRELYASVHFDEVEMNNPLSSAEMSSGPRSRALLFQVGIKQTVDGAKAEAASMALSRARTDNIYAPVSDAFMPVIVNVPPRSDLIWFAGDAVRAFALAGDFKAAGAWLNLLRANANLTADAADALVKLVPVIRLAGMHDVEGAITERFDTLDNWLNADRILNDDPHRAVLLFTLLENLGEPVDITLWESLGIRGDKKVGILPDPVVWQRLEAISRTGKIGETTTLALIMLGNEGPAFAGPLVMGHVARVLTLNGYEADARALSVEAALAAGL